MNADSGSSSGTPPPPTLPVRPSVVARGDGSSSSTSSATLGDSQTYYVERIPCWCAACHGTHRRMRRICFAHMEQYGPCPDMPPQEEREHPMVSDVILELCINSYPSLLRTINRVPCVSHPSYNQQ